MNEDPFNTLASQICLRHSCRAPWLIQTTPLVEELINKCVIYIKWVYNGRLIAVMSNPLHRLPAGLRFSNTVEGRQSWKGLIIILTLTVKFGTSMFWHSKHWCSESRRVEEVNLPEQSTLMKNLYFCFLHTVIKDRCQLKEKSNMQEISTALRCMRKWKKYFLFIHYINGYISQSYFQMKSI